MNDFGGAAAVQIVQTPGDVQRHPPRHPGVGDKLAIARLPAREKPVSMPEGSRVPYICQCTAPHNAHISVSLQCPAPAVPRKAPLRVSCECLVQVPALQKVLSM